MVSAVLSALKTDEEIVEKSVVEVPHSGRPLTTTLNKILYKYDDSNYFSLNSLSV